MSTHKTQAGAVAQAREEAGSEGGQVHIMGMPEGEYVCTQKKDGATLLLHARVRRYHTYTICLDCGFTDGPEV